MEEINQNIPAQYLFSTNNDQYLINLDNIGEKQFWDLIVESIEIKNGKIISVDFYIDKFDFHMNEEKIAYIEQNNIPFYNYLVAVNDIHTK